MLDDVLIALLGPNGEPRRRQVVADLLEQIAALPVTQADLHDLEVAARALSELLEGALLFERYRDRPKIAIFGSARTGESSELYAMARDLGARMAERGWMVVSGAGPGIMEASSEGAGSENVLGVNIDLPHEQRANPYIDVETRLVEMRYFFTRKVSMTRPSNAFAVFPGGLGTMDELFEVLTLIHTGKSSPAPVVLVDTPAGNYWERLFDFVREEMIDTGYLDAPGLRLARVVDSIPDAIAEIDRFYSNYVGFTLINGDAELCVRTDPTDEQLEWLAAAVPEFSRDEGWRRVSPGVLRFPFDGRRYDLLRVVIDEVNRWLD